MFKPIDLTIDNILQKGSQIVASVFEGIIASHNLLYTVYFF